MVGDNRDNALDSRMQYKGRGGTVPLAKAIGKVFRPIEYVACETEPLLVSRARS
jgi:hypothetical protein